MELWIVSGLVLAVIAVGAATRLRRAQRRPPAEETKNIYPLW